MKSFNDIPYFIKEIENFERSGSSSTSMADAITQAVAVLTSCPYEIGRKIIDVSGDGPDTNNEAMQNATKQASSLGIRINGLPIIDPTEPNLHEWYETFVKTGPGSFVIPAYGFEDFERAMSLKIIGDMG